MIANLVLYLGATTSILSLIEFIFPDVLKRFLSDATLRLWMRLDNAKSKFKFDYRVLEHRLGRLGGLNRNDRRQ